MTHEEFVEYAASLHHPLDDEEMTGAYKLANEAYDKLWKQWTLDAFFCESPLLRLLK